MNDYSTWLATINGPHQGQPIHVAGADLTDAKRAVVMIHGRGATAESILDLSRLLPQGETLYLAPQAAGSTWYPYRFTEPRALNEPGLSSAHEVIGRILQRLQQASIAASKTVLLGFSQGACLATDYAALNADRYGGVIGLSGGLIGQAIAPDRYSGNLDDTPMFLGCSDIDPHIPVERVHETARVLSRLGGNVTTEIYPGMGHTINQQEIEHARRIIYDG